MGFQLAGLCLWARTWRFGSKIGSYPGRLNCPFLVREAHYWYLRVLF